jgi:Domain of unknown function (DUF4386)
MKSRQQTATLAAKLYIAWAGLSAAVTLTYFPAAFVVKGDAAATALRIVSSPMLYRAAVLGDLLAGVLSIYMAMALYELFRDVDRGQARLMVAFVLLQVAMAFAIMLMQIAPLVLLNGASYWSAFEKPQLDALALGCLSLRGQGISAMSAYWGLWLVPLGVLVYKSGFLPRIIGVFLLVAGGAYVASTITFFFSPAYYRLVFYAVTTPAATLGEIGFIGWVLIKGVRADASAGRPPDSGNLGAGVA